jgi:hypothetical protein
MGKHQQAPKVEEPVPPCDPGAHVDDLIFPEVPKGEMSVPERIKKMEEAGADPFEIKAAKHNYKNKHITKGNQISRPRTPGEAAEGKSGEHQHIRAKCRICGFEREIDMAVSKFETIECKNQQGPFGGTDQIRNNEKFASLKPRKVTYKIPADQVDDRRTDRLRGFATVVGV